MSKLQKIIYGIATISGTAVGVGIFSLPYIALQVGFPIVVGYFLVLGFLVTIAHLFFAHLSLATPDFKRLPGFAKFYFGKWGEKIALVSSVFGTFGAILAYLIVGGSFLEGFLSPFLNISGNLYYTLIYFIAGAALVFFGIKAIAQIEFLGIVSFFWVLILIFVKAEPLIQPAHFAVPPDFISYLFLPYGAVLFSLWGAALIPETEEMLGEDKKLLKIIIPIATFIPIIIYLFFIYVILGITGPATTESALTGLQKFLGNRLTGLTLFLGVLTTFTSFITLGLTLKRIFCYDLNIGKNVAWFLTCFPPLIIFLLGLKNFITVISLGGGIMLGIDGVLILLMYGKLLNQKKGKKAWLMITPFVVIFLIGLVLEVIHFLT